MKILYFTDPHIRATSPGSRLDDFPATVLNKLRWIGEYARGHEIKTIVVGGDWLDRPDIAYSMLNKLVRELLIWKTYGITVYTVLGNHDLYGYNPLTFDRTALSLLCNMGLLVRLSKEPIVVGNVSLTGVDAYYGLDKGDNYVNDYINVKGDDDKLKINVVHGFLDDQPWGDIVPMTLIDDILHTEAEITLTGHEHSGYGMILRKGKAFCNPGALCRVTAGVGDINQEVKVAVIEVDKNNFYQITSIPLPIIVARPASEVLDREKLDKEKENTEKLAAFSSVVGGFQASDSLNFYTVLDEIAKEDSVNDLIIEGVRASLERAEEEIKKGGNAE